MGPEDLNPGSHMHITIMEQSTQLWAAMFFFFLKKHYNFNFKVKCKKMFLDLEIL